NCGADEPELVPGEPRDGGQNLFVRDNTTSTYQLINQSSLISEPADAIYQGSSTDLSVVAFSLEPKKITNPIFYVWAGGTVDQPLTVLPDGQPTAGEIGNAAVLNRGNPTSPSFSHAVAPDGSRIEFTAGGKLYSRLNPGAPQSVVNGAEECLEP